MSKGIKPNDLVLNSTLQRLDDYKAALGEVIRINNLTERATLKLARAGNKNSAQYKKAQAELLRIEKTRRSSLRSLNKEAVKNGAIQKHRIKNNINLKKTIAQVDRSTKKAESSLSKYNKTTKKSYDATRKLGSYLKSAGVAMLGLLGIQAVGVAISSAFNTLKKLDSLNFTLKTLIKNQEDISRTTTFLKDISNKYGAEIVVLTERYIKFLAAAKQSNIAMKDTEKIYESIVKAAGVMGLSQHELEGALLAVEQMMSKGKVTTEELRRQLGERMPGAFGIMAAAVNRLHPNLEVTVAVLDDMLRKGEILSAEVLPLFAEELEKAYGIEQVDRVNTLVAAQTRYNNKWIDFVEAVENGEGRISKVLIAIYELMEDTIDLFMPFDQVKENGINIKFGYDTMVKSIKELTGLKVKNLETDGKELTLLEKKNIELEKAKNLRTRVAKDAETELTKLDNFTLARINYLADIDRLNKEIELPNGKGSKSRSLLLNDLVEAKTGLKVAEDGIKEFSRTYAIEIGSLKAIDEIIDPKDKLKPIKSKKPTGGKKTAKKISSFNTRDLTQYNTLLLIGRENQLKLLKSELSLGLSYIERRGTLEKILIIEKDIAKVKERDAKKKLSSKYESDLNTVDNAIIKVNNTVAENKRKGFNTEGAEAELKKLNKYKLALEEKYIHDKLVLETNLSIKLRKIEANNSSSKIDNLRKAFQDTSKGDSVFNINENNSLSKLAIAYKNDEFDYEGYEERKTEIANHYAKLRMQNAITLLEDLLIQQKALGDHEGVTATIEAISQLNKQINEVGISEPEAKIDKLNDFLDQFQSAFTSMIDSIADLTDALYERNISDLEDRLNSLEEFYDRQYDLAEGDAEQQRLVREEEKAATDKINKEIAAEKTKQAKAAKSFAMFNAVINTAGAIIGFLANPSGPAGIALSVLAGITGAAQIAAIASRPIPKYKDGRVGGIAEYAYVGDGGKNEYVEDSSGIWKTPNVATLTYLEKGANVYKDKTDLVKNGKQEFVRSISTVNPQPQYYTNNTIISSEGIKDEIAKGFDNSKIIVVVKNNNYNNYKNNNLRF